MRRGVKQREHFDCVVCTTAMVAGCSYRDARAETLEHIVSIKNGVNWHTHSLMLTALTGEQWSCWELAQPVAFSQFQMPSFQGDFILGVQTDYRHGTGYRHSIYATRAGIYEPRRGRWFQMPKARRFRDFQEWYVARIVARESQFGQIERHSVKMTDFLSWTR